MTRLPFSNLSPSGCRVIACGPSPVVCSVQYNFSREALRFPPVWRSGFCFFARAVQKGALSPPLEQNPAAAALGPVDRFT